MVCDASVNRVRVSEVVKILEKKLRKLPEKFRRLRKMFRKIEKVVPKPYGQVSETKKARFEHFLRLTHAT